MGFVVLGCHLFPVLFEDLSQGHSLAEPQDKGKETFSQKK